MNTACLQKKRGRKNDPRRHVAIDPEQHAWLERHLVSHEPPPDEMAMTNEAWDHLEEAFGATNDNERLMLVTPSNW